MVEIAGVALRWHAPASRLNIEAPDGAMLSVRIVEGAISGDLVAGPPDPSGIRPVEGQDFGLILEPGARAVVVFAGGARIEYRAAA